ncbi:hypothetical protein QQX98_009953 [Neonectria punicea]|uniref:Uncharacterized protein n=1 Tax=Neonectria punicea TaxID=979145 RepID=A0ABR1GR73_9HYPO
MTSPNVPLIPRKQKDHGEKLDTLKQLAHQTALNIYIGCNSLSDAQARILCSIVLGPKVRTASRDRHLFSLDGSDGDKLLSCSEKLPPVSPRLYNQPSSAPSLLVEKSTTTDLGAVPMKRRRNSGGTSNPFESALLEAIKMSLDQQKGDIRNELRQTKQEILDHIDKRFGDLDIYNREEVDDKFYEMDKEIYDSISTKVDEDNLDDVRVELQTYLKDEMRAMKSDMVKRLEVSSWNLKMEDGSESEGNDG